MINIQIIYRGRLKLIVYYTELNLKALRWETCSTFSAERSLRYDVPTLRRPKQRVEHVLVSSQLHFVFARSTLKCLFTRLGSELQS